MSALVTLGQPLRLSARRFAGSRSRQRYKLSPSRSLTEALRFYRRCRSITFLSRQARQQKLTHSNAPLSAISSPASAVLPITSTRPTSPSLAHLRAASGLRFRSHPAHALRFTHSSFLSPRDRAGLVALQAFSHYSRRTRLRSCRRLAAQCLPLHFPVLRPTPTTLPS